MKTMLVRIAMIRIGIEDCCSREAIMRNVMRQKFGENGGVTFFILRNFPVKTGFFIGEVALERKISS